MKGKSVLIISLCIILLIMGAGYSIFSSKLNINSSSSVTSNWDVEITNIAFKNKVGYAEEVNTSFDKTSANINANFTSPGDAITYDITISNKGTLDATLDYIKIKMSEQNIINYKIDGINSNEIIEKGKNKTFTLTMTYNENITSQPSITSTDFKMDLSFLQKGNFSNFNSSNSLSDTLSINKIDLSSTETSIRSVVDATNAIKYYYSIDNDKWYESDNNTYEIFNLSPYKDYTVYIKAEDIEGNVVFGSNMIKTKDETPPTLEFTLDGTLGNNNIYKGLNINVKALDNDNIASIKYCIDSQKCTPNTNLTLTNNIGKITLSSSANAQVVCITATDPKGNTASKCTDKLMIDTETPKINDMTLTINENTITVNVKATDNHSGVAKYYYSKDNGETYIESENSNYTFTSLDEGDYLITAYVTDEAGNKSDLSMKATNVRYEEFCKQNNIDNLSDCIIAEETNNASINEAKTLIKEKGTPDFNITSPVIKYGENKSSKSETITTEKSYLWIGENYTFDSSKGIYRIPSGQKVEISDIDLKNGKTYYTNGTDWDDGKLTYLYKLIDITSVKDEITGKIKYTYTAYKYNATIKNYDTTGVGMYASKDNAGDTYYYRGSVSGNYVKFANFYWRIIRINGDSTLRLIYDGTEPHENGETSSDRQLNKSSFNKYINDNTYAGYMYANKDNFTVTESETTFVDDGLSSSKIYYFADSYTFDKDTRKFKLSGNIISGKVSEDKVGYYTFFNTSKDYTNQRLFYTVKYNSQNSMGIKGYGYGTNSKEEARTNITDSTIKTYLDSWYDQNLKNFESAISKDEIFCNDRTIYSQTHNSYTNKGYGNNPTILTNYQKFNIWVKPKTGPILTCDVNDSFSVNGGNKSLKNPVGLITADEVNMAGGVITSTNNFYYLYTGSAFWTISPSHFDSEFVSFSLGVTAQGGLKSNTTWDSLYVKPVINIDTSKITFTGVGTKENPYNIEIKAI